ncbi:hypothetical protein WJR50_32895 [Catalinimonas sp. 4WD22]|uniref:hypothetical protein n=1 Tax=Catalinimonas locisalis TaxID=3133978 RepID=UPI00310121F4
MDFVQIFNSLDKQVLAVVVSGVLGIGSIIVTIVSIYVNSRNMKRQLQTQVNMVYAKENLAHEYERLKRHEADLSEMMTLIGIINYTPLGKENEETNNKNKKQIMVIANRLMTGLQEEFVQANSSEGMVNAVEFSTSFFLNDEKKFSKKLNQFLSDVEEAIKIKKEKLRKASS